MVVHGRDRLSALPDKALAGILSHLESNEAARASVLSSRWRLISAAVPVVDLVDGKIRPQGPQRQAGLLRHAGDGRDHVQGPGDADPRLPDPRAQCAA
jgi:hypothetical protein